LKVDDDFIQRVLRHGDSNTTRRFYIKELPAQVVDAMNLMDRELCTIVHRIEEESQHNPVVN